MADISFTAVATWQLQASLASDAICSAVLCSWLMPWRPGRCGGGLEMME